MALLMLLTLRGTPFLYYGDELGMTDVQVPADRPADPLSHRFSDQHRGRDPERTPMIWRSGQGAGFTEHGVEPWLPFGDSELNVEALRDDPASTLRLCRDLIKLRRTSPDLRGGGYTSLDTPDGVWAYRRGAGTTVALNFYDEEVAVPGVRGRIAIASNRASEGAIVDGELRLGPRTGVVLLTGTPSD